MFVFSIRRVAAGVDVRSLLLGKNLADQSADFLQWVNAREYHDERYKNAWSRGVQCPRGGCGGGVVRQGEKRIN
jgi:hypothetical protein